MNTVPETFDNEDDNYDNTKAEVIKDFGEEDDKTEEQLLSVFRKKNVDLLSDIDSRYSGKKASRDSLVESNEDDENDFELPEEISEGDESGLSEEEISEKRKKSVKRRRKLVQTDLTLKKMIISSKSNSQIHL